jgi:hypothetical protein
MNAACDFIRFTIVCYCENFAILIVNCEVSLR